MGRPKMSDAVRRQCNVNVRLTEAGSAELDRLRGSMSRSDYIRDLLKQASEKSKK